jgi:KUP system potassium uptake protein
MNAEEPSDSPPPGRSRLYARALGALGVVFGDIGTSPLYALRACFAERGGVTITPDNVLGVLSLVFWSLIVVISLKYVAFVMRADNRGEGGLLALLTLAAPRPAGANPSRSILLGVGIFGAALLYADGVITPAISVLSAVEGLAVGTPALRAYVGPLSVGVLIGLFLFQRRGTGVIGALFGPIMLVWFLVLAGLGIRWIAQAPEVLWALDPLRALEFFVRNGVAGFVVLGAVFLVVTGGEALYADMGHFGRSPIRLAWFSVVLPGLLLNYFGQGALLLGRPAAAESPFYLLAPTWARYPLVLLATAAAVIASQAMITGAFSLTRQALQLGYSPRLEIRHFSAEEIGQVYVPWINWMLLIATIAIVLGFGSSDSLAGAYGVAVSTTMVITTLLAYACARRQWGWGLVQAGTITAFLLIIDLAFFGSNLGKIHNGGWVPLGIAATLYVLMATWKQGRAMVSEQLLKAKPSMTGFITSIEARPPVRAPGTAVFLDSSPYGVPRTLLHNLKHNKVLHERVIFLSIVGEEVPLVPRSERLVVDTPTSWLTRLVASYGFMETPSIPAVLRLARARGLDCELMSTTFFLGRETLVITNAPGMARWRKRLFAFMARNAETATAHFRIPPNRVIELGAQVEI